ncbi:unnamed protein product [Rhizophagus irregularis]|nr:unnamed protein product [Rhizophagus irregularis]
MSLLYTILSGANLKDIFITLLSLICLYIIRFYYKHFTRINPLPGPIPIPLIGSFEIFKNDIDAWFYKLNKSCEHDGVFELNIAGNRQIVITRAEYVEKFLASNSSSINHIMRTANNGLLDLFDLEKKGVGLNHDYQHWKFNRHIFLQAVMPLSSTNKPSQYVNLLFEEMSNYWIDLKHKNDDSVVIDISTWMRRFTSDFISLLTTGQQMSTINYYYRMIKNEEVTKEMIDSENFIESINTFVSDNQILFVPKILRNFPIIKSRVDHMLGNCNYFYGKLVEIVRKRREEMKNSDDINKFISKKNDLLTSLIIANTQYDPQPQKNAVPSLLRPMTDDEIRGVMFDAFVAGTDTTVNTFCFALYYLSHNPDVKKKLVEEIESVFQDDFNRPITFDDLEKLKYCEAVIKETSRVRPTVSMVSRYSSKSDKVAGYEWPSNVLFILYVRGINTNPLYWKDPEKFDPERFYDPQEIENQHKNSFSMFGGGPRMCLVDMQAPLQVETSTITICKELNVKLTPRKRVV